MVTRIAEEVVGESETRVPVLVPPSPLVHPNELQIFLLSPPVHQLLFVRTLTPSGLSYWLFRVTS